MFDAARGACTKRQSPPALAMLGRGLGAAALVCAVVEYGHSPRAAAICANPGVMLVLQKVLAAAVTGVANSSVCAHGRNATQSNKSLGTKGLWTNLALRSSLAQSILSISMAARAAYPLPRHSPEISTPPRTADKENPVSTQLSVSDFTPIL